MEVFGYRKLIAYQKAKEVVKRTYKLLKKFPAEERFAMCDQLRRASISVTSNIAEGASRPSDIDFAHFLDFSLGSAFEVETQLLIAKKIGYIDNDTYNQIIQRLSEIERQLHGLINIIRKP